CGAGVLVAAVPPLHASIYPSTQPSGPQRARLEEQSDQLILCRAELSCGLPRHATPHLQQRPRWLQARLTGACAGRRRAGCARGADCHVLVGVVGQGCYKGPFEVCLHGTLSPAPCRRPGRTFRCSPDTRRVRSLLGLSLCAVQVSCDHLRSYPLPFLVVRTSRAVLRLSAPRAVGT
ncbi:ATP-binding cassette sub-family D member 1, partial [Frankliniella fusca]